MSIWLIRDHHRSNLICTAMAEGIKRCGDIVRMRDQAAYTEPDLDSEVSVFYGLEGNLPKIMREHQRNMAAVYVDLGYWGRREGGRWAGFHKVVVDARHPTAYYRNHPDGPISGERLNAFKLKPAPWRVEGKYILLAGMGDKGSIAEGWEPESWERWAIARIREVTDRPIIYRPKPSWKGAKPIPGTYYSVPRERELEHDLRDCWAVVTHHSNVAVDAIVAGIPAFCMAGVAAEMSCPDLSKINTPFMPSSGREQWMADIAYTQWSIAEMRAGLAWEHLRQEKLI